ncbi:MAG: YerC/YecD family TrpR-related protein, partial [Parcubacteria group bacterium]
MSRYDATRISYQKQNELLNLFCDILFGFKTREEIYNFLKDLLNRPERLMLVRRLLIAEMLMDKKTYREIAEELHCGTVTIARVHRWLNFGRGGYEQAIRVK